MDDVQNTEAIDPGDISTLQYANSQIDVGSLPSCQHTDTIPDSITWNSHAMGDAIVAIGETDEPVVDAVADIVGDTPSNRYVYTEAEEASDTASWDSETPLLCTSTWVGHPDSVGGETWNNVYATEDTSEINKDCNNTAVIEIAATTNKDNAEDIEQLESANQLAETTDIQDVTVPAHERDKMSFIGSITSLLKLKVPTDPPDVCISEVEVEEITYTPLQIIGSGWEFGSLSSINRHHREGFRSRVNTIDNSLTERYNDNRLLTRIFANVVGSNEIVKSKIERTDSIIDLNRETIADSEISRCHNTNLKNIVVISIGMALMFAAIGGLRNLQSSMNAKGGIGVFSLATTYGTFMIGSLVSPFIVRRFKPTACLVAACMCNSLYVVANYMPICAVIMPTSAIMGVALAVIWNALSTYITELSMHEAEIKNQNTDAITSKYFGIFFLAIQFSNVIGNLVSSVILVPDNKQYIRHAAGFEHVDSSGGIYADYTQNTSNSIDALAVGINTTKTSSTCGIAYCLDNDMISSAAVDDLDKLFLLGTYATCVIIAGIVMHCFLDELPDYVPSSANLGEVVRQAKSVLAMCVDKQFALIVMLCAYTMIGNSFVVADVVKAFVTCPAGIHMVGYTMVCFGIFGAISSFMTGKMVNCVGRVPIFVTAATTNIVLLVWMTTWHPHRDDPYLLFVLLGGWGFADGIWQSQINSLISAVFADRYEEAFGCCRVIQGFTGVVVFGISNSLCMMSKVVITGSTCIMALVFYLVLEIFNRNRPITDLEIRVD